MLGDMIDGPAGIDEGAASSRGTAVIEGALPRAYAASYVHIVPAREQNSQGCVPSHLILRLLCHE